MRAVAGILTGMAPTQVSLPLVVVVLIPILFVGALVLIRIALFPRRRGNDPHCANCNYLLIGNVSGRCPECGTDVSTAARVQIGQRHRRPGLATVGFVLLGLALLPFVAMTTGRVQTIDWYHYRPASWLVQDLSASSGPRATRAWNELERRRKLPAGLDPAVEQRLIEAALREQAQPTPGPIGQILVDYLGGQFMANRLSKAQSDRFLAQGAVVQFVAIRRKTNVGDSIPYQLRSTARIPSKGWWVRFDTVKSTIDAQTIPQPGPTWMYTGPGTSINGFGTRTGAAAAGKHSLELITRIDVFQGPFLNDKVSRIIHTIPLTLKTDFETFDKAQLNVVKLIDDPALKPKIKRAVTIDAFDRNPATGEFVLILDIDKPPASIAFDLFARADGKEYALGSIELPKGSQSKFYPSRVPLQSVTASRFDLIFRSSEPAARRTIDLFEIWSGEIVLENVKVGTFSYSGAPVSKPATSPSSPAR